ncbi:MAG: hypothetical protein L0H70_10115 [Xanthomonadales bacterium]|nr:hypothetical protein [Xanthomonadales bacterium]
MANASHQSDPALVALTQAQIDQYLTVMRAAAELVQHPSAADSAARQRRQDTESAAQQSQPARQAADEKIRVAMQTAMAAAQRGDMVAAKAAQQVAIDAMPSMAAKVSVPTDAEYAANMRVMQIDSGSADALVAEQRHIDSNHWDALVDAVETAVPDPQAAYGSGDPLDHPYVPSEHERKVAAVTEVNRQTLVPYRDEIHKLEGIVRHPPLR